MTASAAPGQSREMQHNDSAMRPPYWWRTAPNRRGQAQDWRHRAMRKGLVSERLGLRRL
jgi:hypothetical protein